MSWALGFRLSRSHCLLCEFCKPWTASGLLQVMPRETDSGCTWTDFDKTWPYGISRNWTQSKAPLKFLIMFWTHSTPWPKNARESFELKRRPIWSQEECFAKEIVQFRLVETRAAAMKIAGEKDCRMEFWFGKGLIERGCMSSFW